MTRQYWSNHKKHEGLITNNQHIAGLLINNFRQPEIPMEEHEPYRRWKHWLLGQQSREPEADREAENR